MEWLFPVARIDTDFSINSQSIESVKFLGTEERSARIDQHVALMSFTILKPGAKDLLGIGMDEAQGKSLIEAARTIPEGREHQPFVPKVNSPVSSIMHHLRLQKLKDRLISKLNVKTQEDLERVGDEDLKSIGVKVLHRRRFLAGVAKLPKRDTYVATMRGRNKGRGTP